MKVNTLISCGYHIQEAMERDIVSNGWLYIGATSRHKLSQIYDEARYNLSNLLRIHKIVQDVGLGGKEIIKVLELAKYDELQNLQWKVEYLRVDIKEYTG